MSIHEVGSIYNAQSVYNGGGGGGGSFSIDVGGGVEQTFVFPPYLVPVEYMSLQDYTQDFSILGAKRLIPQATYSFKIVLHIPKSKMSATDYIFMMSPALGYNGANKFQLSLEKSTSRIRFVFSYFGQTYWLNVNSLQFDTDKITLIFKESEKKLIAKDEHGNTEFTTATSTFGGLVGSWTFFGGNNTNVYTFNGVVYYAWIKDDATNNAVALWVPAKNKESGMAYIVECVDGGIGVNHAQGPDFSNIIFGPELDLSGIGNYFQ